MKPTELRKEIQKKEKAILIKHFSIDCHIKQAWWKEGTLEKEKKPKEEEIVIKK